MQAHYLSLKGFQQLIRTISNVKRKINPKLDIATVTKEKQEGRRGRGGEDFQELTVLKETTAPVVWKKSRKRRFGNPPFQNEQIVVFHGLTITAEKMLKIKAMVLLGIEALILNGPSSSVF